MFGAQGLCWHQSGDWSSKGEEQDLLGMWALWAGWCCAPGTTGGLTEPPESLQLVPGALQRCCCSHWGETSPKRNARGLLACQPAKRSLWGASQE